MPCSGRSFIPNKYFSFDDLLETLQEFVEKTGTNDIHLIGHSLGGTMAVALAASLDKKIKTVIALGSPLKPFKNSLIHLAVSCRCEFLNYVKDKDMFRSINTWEDAQDNFHFRHELRIKKLLEQIKIDVSVLNHKQIPTLFLWGKNDMLISLQNNIDLIKQIKHHKLKLYPGGHMWMSALE